MQYPPEKILMTGWALAEHRVGVSIWEEGPCG